MTDNEVRIAYVEKFGQNFPFFQYPTRDIKVITEEMKKCIKNNKPYIPKTEKNAIY